MTTAPQGKFTFSERGIELHVSVVHNRATIWIRVDFSWERLNKMTDREREMSAAIAKVVSRTIAHLEDSHE